MKQSIQHIFYALAGIALLAGCEAEFDNPVGDTSSYSSGTADFSTFVAVGDSLTAGYADNALYRDGQLNSYPAILAQQFALVGGGVFSQPLMPVGATGPLSFTLLGGALPGISDRLVLGPSGSPPPASPAAPEGILPSQVTSIDTRVGNGGFNNMGVPGAKSFHLGSPGYGALTAAAIGGGTANPFFSRFSSSDATTMITDAGLQAPSFFVFWIGNNDILSYATGGGTGVDQNAANNTDPTTYGSEDITDDVFFDTTYNGLLAALTAGTAKGVLVNIPDISTIPYFTTVPFNAIPLDAANATGLNAFHNAYNVAIAASGIPAAEITQRTINWVAGQNPVLILDDSLTTVAGQPNQRQATANDFIVLKASSKIGVDSAGQYGITVPLADLDVLTETEAGFVEIARTAYNATILTAANFDLDLLHFDASAMLTELDTSGIFYGTGGITSTFATGGGFSLDGVHPTARGYAVVANAIIDVINTGFAANVPHNDPGSFTTVFYQ